MKKLWNNNLSSTFTNLGSAATQLSQRLATPANPLPPSEPRSPQVTSPEKQYLRLPIESARKLRWYDKGDVAAIVRTHTREKRDLHDTITALKKLLIKSGFTESSIDEETRQLLLTAQQVRASDDGVDTTLLVSAEAEVGALNSRIGELEAQVASLQTKQLQLQHSFSYSISDEVVVEAAVDHKHDTPPIPAAGPPVTNPQLLAALEQLKRCLDNFDESASSARALAQQVRLQEQASHQVSMREMMDAMPSRLSGSSGEANGDTEGAKGEQDALRGMMAKLQRLELERLAAMDDLAEARSQILRLVAAQQAASSLQTQLEEAEQKSGKAQAAAEKLQQELSGVWERLKAAEELAEKRGQELRKTQNSAQSSELISRYQDACVEAEQRAVVAERRCTLIEARVGKLEVALRDAQGDVRIARQQAKEFESRANEASARVADAAVAASDSSKSQQAENEANRHAAEALQQVVGERDALQREVKTLQEHLIRAEARVQHAEIREARLMAEVREAESTAAERDELAAQVGALRDHLEGSRAERGQLEHYKQMAKELEAGRYRMEGELVTTAQIVTALEARLRECHMSEDRARTSAERAEGRAKAAEAYVSEELERRLQSVGSNRALWPGAIKEEFEKIESRAESLQSALAAVQGELEKGNRSRQQEARTRVEAQRQLLEVEDKLRALEVGSRQRIHDLEAQVEMSQQDADASRHVMLKLEQEMDELLQQQQLAMVQQLRASPQRSSSGNGSLLSLPSLGRVGGGSLYGISDQEYGIAGTPRGSETDFSPKSRGGGSRNGSVCGSPKAREAVGTLDIVYLRNVVLKFIEAVVMGRAVERDALLPAVATILQATPAEYRLLRNITKNSSGAAGFLNSLGLG